MNKDLNLLNKAICIATQSHNNQVDKAGQPYILHPLRVMLSLTNEKDRIVAVLHDVIEDTDITYEYLKEQGFDEEVCDAIKSVTRQDNETYTNFIKRAKLNPIGKCVKIVDLKDNMNIDRIQNPSEEDYKRIKKYKKALKILMED